MLDGGALKRPPSRASFRRTVVPSHRRSDVPKFRCAEIPTLGPKRRSTSELKPKTAQDPRATVQELRTKAKAPKPKG